MKDEWRREFINRSIANVMPVSIEGRAGRVESFLNGETALLSGNSPEQRGVWIFESVFSPLELVSQK